MNAIHISKAREILDRGQPVHLRFVKLGTGEAVDFPDAISLSSDRYKGTRTLKSASSRQIRTIRDCLIISINDIEVFF